MKSVLILALAWIAAGAAGEPRQTAIRLEFAGTVVTVVADHARAADVLTEWARVGHTEVIGADLLSDRTITLNLTRVDEQDALAEIVGAGFGFIGPLKEKPATGTSRFSQIIVSAAKPGRVPAGPSANEPESKYSYPSPAHVFAGGETAPVNTRPAGGTTFVPETVFDYIAPQVEKSVDPGANPEAPAVAVRPTGATSGDPEVLFEYSMPKQYEPPPGTRAGSRAPARTDGDRVDPESRFDYFRSGKTFEPPKKASPEAAECSGTTAATSKEKCG
jgi:hypothetical protein